jgi:hypothetical protein
MDNRDIQREYAEMGVLNAKYLYKEVNWFWKTSPDVFIKTIRVRIVCPKIKVTKVSYGRQVRCK